MPPEAKCVARPDERVTQVTARNQFAVACSIVDSTLKRVTQPPPPTYTDIFGTDG